MYQLKLADGRVMDSPRDYRQTVRRARGLAVQARMEVAIYRNGEFLDRYVYTEYGPKRADNWDYAPLELRVREI